MELLIFPFLPENAHRFENVSRAGYTYSPGNNRLRRHLESVRSRYACQCNTLGGSSELMQIVFRIGSVIPGSVPSLPASPQGPRNRDHPKSWMRRRMSWSSEGYRSCYASSLDSGTKPYTSCSVQAGVQDRNVPMSYPHPKPVEALLEIGFVLGGGDNDQVIGILHGKVARSLGRYFLLATR